MTSVNKLQLVDVSKLNAILEMFKKKNESEEIINSIKNPELLSIGEKKTNMEKIDDRQNENVVEFLKKKNAMKRSYDIEEEKKKEEKEENDMLTKRGKITQQLTSSVQQQHANELNDFFEKKKFKESSSGNIKIGSVSVNKKDLLYDLTHQAVKDTSFNLSVEQRVTVLRELKKTGMPASNIRNTSLKKLYITGGKKNFGESSFLSSGESDTGSFYKKKKKSSLDYDRLSERGRR